jgi:hypothetical protein
VTPSPDLTRYIRIEFPYDATEEEYDRFALAVSEVVDKYSDEFDYDISVSGASWYAPIEYDVTPLSVAHGKLRSLIYARPLADNPVDASVLRASLQELSDLGMSQLDLQIHLERERAKNEVAFRNMMAEQNLLTALDMVVGNVVPMMRVKFQAGTQ